MSVVIVSAETGCIDSAKPVISEVITNPRRLHFVRVENPSNPISGPSIVSLPLISHESNFLFSAPHGKCRSPKSEPFSNRNCS